MTQTSHGSRSAAALLVGALLAAPATAQVVPDVFSLGGGAGTPVPSLNATSPLLTADLTVFLTGVAPGCPITLFISPPAPPLDFGPGVAWVDPTNAMIFEGTTDGSGNWSVTFPTIALVGFQPGVQCNLQAVCLTNAPGAASFFGYQGFVSNAVAIVMGDLPADPPSDVPSGACCTYSKGGFSGPGAPGKLMNANFAAAFPAGFVVGLYNPANGNAPHNGKKFTADVAGRNKLKDYLKGGGPSGVFAADTLNDSESTGGGALGRQTAALALNVRFNDLQAIPNACALGDLVYVNPGDSLSGATVRQILDAAHQALGGAGFPAGYGASSLQELVERLNLSFHECAASEWAGVHLFQANA